MHTGIVDSLCAFFHYTLYRPVLRLPESPWLLKIVQVIYIGYQRNDFYFSQKGWGVSESMNSVLADF